MNLSPAVLQSFVEESNDILDSISQSLDFLYKNINAPPMQVFHQILRGIHTIKGDSGFLGYHNITNISSSLEDILVALRERDLVISTVVIDRIYEGVDLLFTLVERSDNAEETKLTSIISSINQLIGETSNISASENFSIPIDLGNDFLINEDPKNKPTEIKKSSLASESKSAEKLEIPQSKKEINLEVLIESKQKSLPASLNGALLHNILNRNEKRVIKEMFEIVPGYPGFDQCPICTEDIYALTMNNITPEYAQDATIVLRNKVLKDTIRSEIYKSLQKIIAKPNHRKED